MIGGMSVCDSPPMHTYIYCWVMNLIVECASTLSNVLGEETLRLGIMFISQEFHEWSEL